MTKKVTWTVLIILATLLLAACSPGGGQPAATVEPDEASPQPAATEAPTAEPATTEPPTAEPPTAEPTTAEPTTAATTAPAAGTLEEFINTLQQAIAARDFATLQALMSDPFAVGYWLSEGVSYTPAEAAAFLETTYLPPNAQIIWADPDMDLAPLLQGMSPATFLGPDKEVAAALLSYGWGEDGATEAIQFISQQPDGSYRWELILVSGFGFSGMPTDVTSVTINADEAIFYSGPGETYEPVATVFGGMPYPVIGVSTDGLWWRLRCYDDNNVLIPQCWVSADPAVAAPAQ